MLRVPILKKGFQGLSRLIGAGEEACLVGVQSQTRLFQLPLESPKGSNGFSGSKISIPTVYVIADVIDPSLQGHSWMCLNKGLKRSIQDELGDCWSLWAALKNAPVIVAWISAFRLDGAGPSVEVQCELEMQRRVAEFAGRFNDLVEIYMVIEASEVCWTCDRVDALMFCNLCMEHSSNCYAETVSSRPRLVPRKGVMQGELPSLKNSFSAGAPNTIKATCQSNGSFDLAVLWNEHDVGCPKLYR